MKIPKSIQSLTESFEKLPGIGPKSAQRLVFYLLHVPQSQLDEFATNLSDLKKTTIYCSICKNVSEEDPCPICTEKGRNASTIMIVEEPLDLVAIEKTSKYRGLYHVLHGRISPLENIGPDEIFISDLIKRVKANDGAIFEVIIATNPNMEGEATAMYITKELRKLDENKLKITRLGMGIPTGADLEYADEITLSQAIEGRREM